jgi:hypothetical protein
MKLCAQEKEERELEHARYGYDKSRPMSRFGAHIVSENPLSLSDTAPARAQDAYVRTGRRGLRLRDVLGVSAKLFRACRPWCLLKSEDGRVAGAKKHGLSTLMPGYHSLEGSLGWQLVKFVCLFRASSLPEFFPAMMRIKSCRMLPAVVVVVCMFARPARGGCCQASADSPAAITHNMEACQRAASTVNQATKDDPTGKNCLARSRVCVIEARNVLSPQCAFF